MGLEGRCGRVFEGGGGRKEASDEMYMYDIVLLYMMAEMAETALGVKCGEERG